MFHLGQQVSWQSRNKNDTARFKTPFFMHKGTVIAVSDSCITCEYTWTRDGYNSFTSEVEFRQLRNGRWIPSQERSDDPKGRLYLEVYSKELETAE